MTQRVSGQNIQNAALNNIAYWVGICSMSLVMLMTFAQLIIAVIMVQRNGYSGRLRKNLSYISV